MLRRMMIETIRNDPDYNNGNYTTPPRMMKYRRRLRLRLRRRHPRLSNAGADG
jgi:homoserine acetyltransferase